MDDGSDIELCSSQARPILRMPAALHSEDNSDEDLEKTVVIDFQDYEEVNDLSCPPSQSQEIMVRQGTRLHHLLIQSP